MENYTNTQMSGSGVEREKSVYLVHLDNVRIVILACMLIGVIAISFLIGMHLSGQSSDDIYRETAVRSSTVAPVEEPVSDDLLAKDASAVPAAPGDTKLSANDLLAPATVQPQAAAPRAVDAVVPQPTAAPKPAVHKSVQTVKSEPKVKPKTVAVSAPKPEESVKKGYSVQIGSFDSRDKAVIEVNRLQRLSYQPFIDRADINGKTYFRVKIGPLASRSAAVETMNELQSTDKYKDSFIIFQK